MWLHVSDIRLFVARLSLPNFRSSVLTRQSDPSPVPRHTVSNQALRRYCSPLRTPVNSSTPLTDLDPDDLSNEEINFADPTRAEIGDAWKNYSLDIAIPGVVVGPPQRRDALLLPPRSKNALYQNLLYLITHHDTLPSLPALIDYHDMFPKFQSARSYNLLIGLALRHTNYGSAQWLLQSMKVNNVHPNLETSKLRVRWFVQTGRSRDAFEFVKSLSFNNGHRAGTQQLRQQSKKMLSVWLELYRPAKGRFIYKATVEGKSNRSSLKSLPPATMAHFLRCPQLLELKSLITSETLSEMSPGLAYHMIRFLLQVGDTSTARSMTNTYLSNLPRRLPRYWARSCLHIVHLHLTHGCSTNKGLARFFEIRRTLVDILKHHNGIQPTSTTLLHLLAPLRRAKRCGTIAWKVLNSFKPQIRRKIVDSRVRKRVIMLADKEGRTDIIEKIRPYERSFRLARYLWRMERDVLGGRKLSPYKRLLRSSQGKVFRQNGKYLHGWHLLRRRSMSRTTAKQSHE